jgi:tetratricopeptide (TPR) repeat protein
MAILFLLSLGLSAITTGQDFYSLAVTAFQQGRFNDVIGLLAQLPAEESERPASLNLKALALSGLRRYDEALTVSRKACDAEPNNTNYLYNAGLIYIAKKDFGAAERLFRGALERFPNASKLYEGLGESQFVLYELTGAEKSLRRAAELEPSSGSAQVALAKLFYAVGNKEQLGLAASKAIQIAPENYQACYYYGLWLAEYQNNAATAAQYFEKSIRLYPGFSSSLLSLGKIEAKRENWTRAVELYEQALAVDSQTRQLYFLAATAYRKLGNKDKAEWAMKQFQALPADSGFLTNAKKRP